jgi:hypothetical protein
MRRLPLIAAIVLVAILVTPYALAPGFNSADVIWILSPAGVLAVGWSRRSRAPQRAVSEHVEARRDADPPSSASRRP